MTPTANPQTWQALNQTAFMVRSAAHVQAWRGCLISLAAGSGFGASSGLGDVPNKTRLASDQPRD